MKYEAQVRLVPEGIRVSCEGPSGNRYAATGADLATASASLKALLVVAESQLAEVRAASKGSSDISVDARPKTIIDTAA